MSHKHTHTHTHTHIHTYIAYFTETPVYGLTIRKMNTTGRHDITLKLKWGTGSHALLKGEVWVYVPLTPLHVTFLLPNTSLTPPGMRNDLINVYE